MINDALIRALFDHEAKLSSLIGHRISISSGVLSSVLSMSIDLMPQAHKEAIAALASFAPYALCGAHRVRRCLRGIDTIGIEEGDLVLSNINAWEGAIAIARKEYDGCIASHRYITCVPDPMTVTVGFLAYFLLSPEGLEQIGFASPGTADRNGTLSLMNLGKIEV